MFKDALERGKYIFSDAGTISLSELECPASHFPTERCSIKPIYINLIILSLVKARLVLKSPKAKTKCRRYRRHAPNFVVKRRRLRVMTWTQRLRDKPGGKKLSILAQFRFPGVLKSNNHKWD
jgi:hypothetical protein